MRVDDGCCLLAVGEDDDDDEILFFLVGVVVPPPTRPLLLLLLLFLRIGDANDESGMVNDSCPIFVLFFCFLLLKSKSLSAASSIFLVV